MKRRIQKHIEAADYVKLEIAEKTGDNLARFSGIILGQSPELILMSDSFDFYYDGLVLLRRSDIDEIRCSDNERFMKRIMQKEGMHAIFKKRAKALDIPLSSFAAALEHFRKLEIPVIIQRKYHDEDIFQIGPVMEVTDKKVLIKYFNARGEFTKPVSSKLKDITYIHVDSPYANTFYKYAKEVA